MKTYQLEPRDLLFFRDGRPIDDDKSEEDLDLIGHGAQWPRPDHLFNGVIHALLGDRMAPKEKKVEFGSASDLHTWGPYPVDEKGEVYLPRPLDWCMERKAIPKNVVTDLPMEVGFIDHFIGKKDYPAWIRLSDFIQYLSNNGDRTLHVMKEDCDDDPEIQFPYKDSDLFEKETRTGNTLDPYRRTSKRVMDKERSGLYHAEYLRLAPGVTMRCGIDTGKSDRQLPASFIMGGQGGMVSAMGIDSGQSLEQGFGKIPHPTIPDIAGEVYVRYTLISPALYRLSGWRPGWINEGDNKVMLHDCEPRKIGEDRSVFKERQNRAPYLDATLVGACTGKPIAFSGWDNLEGIKPTVLAVPAGSVYLFKCPSDKAARRLATRLHLSRLSDLGEKGFGIGVCSLVYLDGDSQSILVTNKGV